MGVNFLYIAAPVAVIVILRILYGFSAPLKKRPVKMPGAGFKLIYSDARDKRADVESKILSSEYYGLRGKPDFIYRKKHADMLVPVELKSGSIKDAEPHRGDLLQLAAYFLIISEAYGTVPKYGFLIYKDFMFKVKNTRALRKELEGILEDMRDIIISGEISGEVDASFVTCRHCVCRDTVCEFYAREG